MANAQRYPLNQSPLYRLGSKRRLADALRISLRDLEFVLSLENYRTWDLQQKRTEKLAGLAPKKPRKVQQPKPLLALLQSRIAQLLARIERPDFVYSATKGRCYVDNAKQHQNPHRAVKVDIKDFYPSVRQKRVRNFFARDLECAPDVAHMLARLCCANGTLATGSPVSPVLSYFACAHVFERIRALAEQQDLVFTLYVDDMAFSGENANVQFASRVERELAAAGLVGHKIRCFRPNSVKIVTGVAVWPDRIVVPNERQRRMRKFEEAFWACADPDDIALLGTALVGQYREAERLQHGSALRARPIGLRMQTVVANRFADLTAVAPRATTRAKRRRSKYPVQLAKEVAKLRVRTDKGAGNTPESDPTSADTESQCAAVAQSAPCVGA